MTVTSLLNAPIMMPAKYLVLTASDDVAEPSVPSKPQHRHGVVVVELAIVLPLILLVFFGVIYVTQSIMLRDSAQHAAYEGARRGLVLNATAAECAADALQFLERINVRGATATVSPENISLSTPQVSVRVSIPLSENAWVQFFPVQHDFVREITLTREFAP